MRLQRYPMVPVIALAAYLAVHVFAAVLHHHQVEHRYEGMPAAGDTKLQFEAAGLADSDEEDDCLLCSVLHLAQTAASALHVHTFIAVSGEALPATAIIRPHPLETTTHSRGPPMI